MKSAAAALDQVSQAWPPQPTSAQGERRAPSVLRCALLVIPAQAGTQPSRPVSSFLRRQEPSHPAPPRHSCAGRNPAIPPRPVIPAQAGTQPSRPVIPAPSSSFLRRQEPSHPAPSFLRRQEPSHPASSFLRRQEPSHPNTHPSSPIHPSPLPGGRLGGGWESRSSATRRAAPSPSCAAPLIAPRPLRLAPRPLRLAPRHPSRRAPSVLRRAASRAAPPPSCAAPPVAPRHPSRCALLVIPAPSSSFLRRQETWTPARAAPSACPRARRRQPLPH